MADTNDSPRDVQLPEPCRPLGQPRIELDSTTSTMDEIRARQEGAPEGLTVVAARQTAGQGRSGRTWLDVPHASLLFSTLLRPECPPEQFTLFPVVSGLAVVQALETVYGVAAHLKWPNDVLVDGRKLAGILVTSRVREGLVVTAMIGIGINLLEVPPELSGQAIALAELTTVPVDRETLLEAVLQNLTMVYEAVVSGETDALLEMWKAHAVWLGEPVTVRVQDNVMSGVIKGIARSGALQLVTAEGQIVEISSGEVSRGPRRQDAHSGS